MVTEKERKVKNNTAYYNLNLLDELDYVIGGYGQASVEFIFTLNNFIESYVLNDNFLISSQEWKHYFLVSNEIFPNGRPITDLVITHKNGIQIAGFPFYMKLGQVKYVEPVNKLLNSKEESEFIKNFQEKNSDYIKENFSKSTFFTGFDTESRFLLSQVIDNPTPDKKSYVVLETKINPKVILERIYENCPNSNFQVTLPLTALKEQLLSNQRMNISRESVTILSELHTLKIEEIKKYTGYNNIVIPPLVPILLSQCNDISDIPSKLLQLRYDFTDLRNSFISFEKDLEQADSLKKQMKIIEEYKAFWETFHKKHKLKSNRLMYHFWDVQEKGDASNSIEKLIDSKGENDFLKDINASKITGTIISKLYDSYKDKKILNRFKGMTNLWDLFDNSPTLNNQVKDIERIFNIKVDLNRLSEISKQLQK